MNELNPKQEFEKHLKEIRTSVNPNVTAAEKINKGLATILEVATKGFDAKIAEENRLLSRFQL